MKISPLLSLILPLAISFSVNAEVSKMKPGLWEHSFTVKSQSGKVEKAIADLKTKMAKMTETQREMMVQAMASQGLGINQQVNSVKVCITKEQAENLEIPQGQNQNCTNEVVSRTADTIKIKFECKGASKTAGEGEFKLMSPTAYNGKSVIHTTIDSKPDIVNMNQKGKWLSSDCGTIKPVQPKK